MESYFLWKRPLLRLPHSIMASMMGMSERPSGVKSYSERGGHAVRRSDAASMDMACGHACMACSFNEESGSVA